MTEEYNRRIAEMSAIFDDMRASSPDVSLDVARRLITLLDELIADALETKRSCVDEVLLTAGDTSLCSRARDVIVEVNKHTYALFRLRDALLARFEEETPVSETQALVTDLLKRVTEKSKQ